MNKKILSMLLVLCMLLSLVACGGGGNSNSGSGSQGGDDTVDPNTPMAELNSQDNFDQAAYDEASDSVYDATFADFDAAYQVAKAETQDVNLRTALMAIAEAKLLQSGAFLPNYDGRGNYSISRTIPRTTPTIQWGYDGAGNGGNSRSYMTELVADRFLTPDERSEITAKWMELKGTGTFLDWAKQWAADNGITLATEIVGSYDDTMEPEVWDVLSTANGNDGGPISGTLEGLLTYDCENVQQPGLAESYEVSEDGLTYTFHIRKGVKWVSYEGAEIAEVKADDWVAAMQHLCDTDSPLEEVLDGTIKNLHGYYYDEITDFSQVGVKALDDYTLEYTLETPAPWFPTVAGYSVLMPMCRSYYESLGGKFGEEFDANDAGYTYAADEKSMAYCGPYLIKDHTKGNTFVFEANPAYWNAGKLQIKKITWRYADGSDPLFTYNNVMNGTFTESAGLNTSALPLAKETKVPDDPDGKTYFEKYAFENKSNGTYSYHWWFNLNRYAYANYNDETIGVSSATYGEAERTSAAIANKNFRLAVIFATDRATYRAQSTGDETKYFSLINTFVPGDLVSLTEDTTVDINGTSTTFPAGTYYGEIIQAQIDADGFDIKVWDPEGNDGAGSSKGFDGWYNPEAAVEYLNTAIEELAAEGVEISEENPIHLEMAGMTYSTIGNNMDQATKKAIEANLGGKVVIDINEMTDSTHFGYATFYGGTGYRMNYDYNAGSGWGADYGDPQTYLDTMAPDGYMMCNMGIF